MTNFPTPINNRTLREKAPLILILAIITVITAYLLIDTLEDTLVEGGSFSGTPVAAFLNAIIAFTQDTTATVQSWGYIGLLVLMALESSSLPIPSEVVLPFAGYLVSQGLLNFWLSVAVATMAAILGSLVDYYIGLKGARLLTKRKTIRNLLYSQRRMETAERWFTKHGASTVFLSRLVPGFRTLVSFPAGAMKMPLSKFLAFTTAGCLLWDTILIYLGTYVGANWREVAGVVHYLIIAAAIAIIVAVVLFLVLRRRKLKGRNFPQRPA